MKTRLISASCYVAILIGFYCLKLFVHNFFFDAFLYVVSLLGTYEMIRALKEKTTSTQRCVTFAFALVALPAVALAEEFFQMGTLVMGVAFFVFCIAILCLLVICYMETTLEGTGLSLLSGLYPTMLLCLLSLVNHASAPAAMRS